MSPTPKDLSLRPLALACGLLLAVVGTGCGEATPEEKLAEATEELTDATHAKEAAQATLDQLEKRLGDAQAARDQAAEAFEEVRQRWQDAKDAVGEFATDEVLHRQVNRALIDEPALEGATITAAVENRVVTLVGGAPDAEAIALAAELADAIPGVAEVVSQVAIESPEVGAPPAEAAPEAEPAPEAEAAPEAEEEPAIELPGLEGREEEETARPPEAHL